MSRNRSYRYCRRYTGRSHTHRWFERGVSLMHAIERRTNLFESEINLFQRLFIFFAERVFCGQYVGRGKQVSGLSLLAAFKSRMSANSVCWAKPLSSCKISYRYIFSFFLPESVSASWVVEGHSLVNVKGNANSAIGKCST